MNTAARLAQFIERLLHLYPRHFRAEFSEEMMDVLTANLGAAASRGWIVLIVTLVREVCGLLDGAIREHRRLYLTKGLGCVDRASLIRRLGQGIAVGYGLWWLLVLLMNATVRADAAIVGASIVLALVGAILAPRHRTLAGGMVFTSGLLVVSRLLLEAFLSGGTLNIALAAMSAMPLLAAGGLILDAPALSGHQPGGVLTTALGTAALVLSW